MIYVAKFESAIYGLHCFKKTSQKTSRLDVALAAQRDKDLMMELTP